MTTTELQKGTPEKHSTQVVANSAAVNLHAEVFSNPSDFIAVLQNNFSQLSHGHNDLTLTDLQSDANDQHFDSKVRTAAGIAANHFKELQGMTVGPFSKPSGDSITSDYLSYAQDMINGHLIGNAIINATGNIAASVAAGGAGYFLGGTALANIGGFAGEASLATEAGLAAVGFTGAMVATGLVGAGLMVGAGLYGYRALTEYNAVKKASDNDISSVNKWIH